MGALGPRTRPRLPHRGLIGELAYYHWSLPENRRRVVAPIEGNQMAHKPGELSDVQFQKMTEQEIWKLLTGGTGLIEVMWPGSDDERIDMDAHIKECFGPHLAIQVKCVSWLARSGKGYRLVKSFDEKVERLHASPLYWYIFAHLSMPILEFTDPLFLVESERVHCCADPQPKGEVIAFTFEASVQPTSRDQWHDCKVAPLDLAARVLELLRKVQGAQGLVPIQMPAPAVGIVVGLRG